MKHVIGSLGVFQFQLAGVCTHAVSLKIIASLHTYIHTYMHTCIHTDIHGNHLFKKLLHACCITSCSRICRVEMRWILVIFSFFSSFLMSGGRDKPKFKKSAAVLRIAAWSCSAAQTSIHLVLILAGRHAVLKPNKHCQMLNWQQQPGWPRFTSVTVHAGDGCSGSGFRFGWFRQGKVSSM